MNEPDGKAIVTVLDPLLRALEMLTFVARHIHPPDFESLLASIGTPDEDLKAARAMPLEWPEHLSVIRAALDAASDATLRAFSGLRKVLREEGDMRHVYRALRLLPTALESLYPLVGILRPSIGSFSTLRCARTTRCKSV